MTFTSKDDGELTYVCIAYLHYIMFQIAPSSSPGQPTPVATTASSFTIKWTEISCLDRNGVITGYTIRYGPVDTSPTTILHTSTDRSRVISGLIPFTNYSVSVGRNE